MSSQRLCFVPLMAGFFLFAGITLSMAQEAAYTPPSGRAAHCVLSTPCPSMPLVLLSRTFALPRGVANVSVTETLGGLKLMIKITDQRGQPLSSATVRAYGTGHFGSRRFSLAPVSPGVFATMANLAQIDELAVRVSTIGGSRVFYMGLPGCRVSKHSCCEDCPGDVNCPCGKNNGANCPCCQNNCCRGETGRCAPESCCVQPAVRSGAACPVAPNCRLHQANQKLPSSINKGCIP